ncbi:MAG: membrane fusion protein (multidrug efflux system), partial [Gammaproteobacteria bacterium]
MVHPGQSQHIMLKKLIVTIFALLIIVGALVGTKMEQFRTMSEVGGAMVQPAEVVTAAAATAGEWERTLLSTGTLAPVQGVTVAAETPGKIQRITFESGIAVKAGDVLVQLETKTEEAQLRAATAAVALARANLTRTKELRKNFSASPAELDSAQAKYDQALAESESIRTNIAKKTIRAPFAGRLGMREVNMGEVLKEGDAITSLQSLNPIYVNFSLPQHRLPLLVLGTPLRVTGDAAPEELFGGGINAISAQVDPVTRSVQLQGTIANIGEALRGGMFVNVQVVLAASEKVLAIPLTAVLFAPFGDSVFVIEGGAAKSADKSPLVLRQRFVRLGTRRGDFVAVSDGLKEGD